MSTYDDPAIADFIKSSFDRYTIVNCVDQDVTGEGEIDRVCEPSMGLEAHFIELFTDVDADSEIELVVALDNGLYVLEQYQGKYTRVATVGVGYSRFSPRVRLTFEDWTGDQHPDIVFDVATTDGGTMLYGRHVSRTILACHSDNCVTSWTGTISGFRQEDTVGGFYRSETQMAFEPASGVSPAMIKTNWSGYSVQCCTYGEGLVIEHPITIYTETETLYSLTALGEYVESSERVLNPISYPDYSTTYDVVDKRGNRAVLEWLPWQANDSCRVVLNGTPMGTPFGCKHILSTITWRDVNSDGLEDLIVVAYEPRIMEVQLDWGKSVAESEWDFPAYTCVGQHLRGYSLQNESSELIADVRGCVVDPNTLFGVKFDDLDGDGQVEITAVIGGSEDGVQVGTAVYRWASESYSFVDASNP